MKGKAIMTAILAVLLTVGVCWAFGGGGTGGDVPADLLLPDAPTHVIATAGDGEATVSFNAPKSDGGSPITGYTVTSRPGKIKVRGKESPITVKGLTNGITYVFKVEAANSIGTGFASGPSNSVTPKAE